MEFRVLRYFVEAAREGSMSRAAAKLHVSQPAMSQQLKALEEELGRKLFQRSNYSIRLTAEGLLFRRRAEDILEMVHKTKTEFETMGGEIAGDVYIGCAESYAVEGLARAIHAMREKNKKIRCHLYSGNGEDLFYRLDGGLLDFSLTLQSVDASKYNSLTLPSEDVWGVILRKDNPLAKKKRIRAADLVGEALICSREAMNEEYPRWFGDALEKHDAAITYNLVYNAAIMVREGLGCLLTLDKLVDTGADSDLCFRPLQPKMTSALHFIWRKQQLLTPAAEALLREMRAMYGTK